MTLEQRIVKLHTLINSIQCTTSTNEKRVIISTIEEDLKDDFQYILEVLDGRYKFGYTYELMTCAEQKHFNTVKEVLEYLQQPLLQKNLSRDNIFKHVVKTMSIGWFLMPIINRTLKLGIGRSVLPKLNMSPMLAKAYDGGNLSSEYGYYITPKLDGNRCIAWHDGTDWQFTSRNGKPMNVSFDMHKFSPDLVYDGEILSPIQNALVHGGASGIQGTAEFSNTSGLINSHAKDKDLIYNIFDIIMDKRIYTKRRGLLDCMDVNNCTTDNVKIVPVLKYYHTLEEMDKEIYTMLDDITAKGGEGLMINLGDKLYEHKRTNALLKLKKVQTMDMQVTDIQWGTGKYDGWVGALGATCKTDDKVIYCSVGSGLSDAQREQWAFYPEEIVGKIIEVAYFDLSQPADWRGTNMYSLRFPRLKYVRDDKTTTSAY